MQKESGFMVESCFPRMFYGESRGEWLQWIELLPGDHNFANATAKKRLKDLIGLQEEDDFKESGKVLAKVVEEIVRQGNKGAFDLLIDQQASVEKEGPSLLTLQGNETVKTVWLEWRRWLPLFNNTFIELATLGDQSWLLRWLDTHPGPHPELARTLMLNRICTRAFIPSSNVGVKTLLKLGASARRQELELDKPQEKSGIKKKRIEVLSPVFHAASHGNARVLDLLLSHGGDPNELSEDGIPALREVSLSAEYAVAYPDDPGPTVKNCHDCITLLIRRGAKIKHGSGAIAYPFTLSFEDLHQECEDLIDAANDVRKNLARGNKATVKADVRTSSPSPPPRGRRVV